MDKPYDRLDGVIWYDGKLVPWGGRNAPCVLTRPALCERRL